MGDLGVNDDGAEDLIKWQAVSALMAGTKRRTVKRLVAREGFPRPILLAPRIERWSLREVRAWLAARPRGWVQKDREHAGAAIGGVEAHSAG